MNSAVRAHMRDVSRIVTARRAQMRWLRQPQA